MHKQGENSQETGTVPTPVVIIDQDSDSDATVVEITFGDRLGALLDTVWHYTVSFFSHSILFCWISNNLYLVICTSLAEYTPYPLYNCSGMYFRWRRLKISDWMSSRETSTSIHLASTTSLLLLKRKYLLDSFLFESFLYLVILFNYPIFFICRTMWFNSLFFRLLEFRSIFIS